MEMHLTGKKMPVPELFLQFDRNAAKFRLPKVRHIRDVPTAWHCVGPCWGHMEPHRPSREWGARLRR